MECSGISTDSRHIAPDSLFVALKGEHFDGNTFALQALDAGAKYAVVSDETLQQHPRCIYVPDTLRALQELAHHHRRQFDIPIVGITGTNGKTTTKELMNAVLCSKYNVLATEGNLNNHIGVPLTLLKLNSHHDIAIIEMGASKRGDIEELVEIAEPTMGLITNIGAAHLEGFGSLQGVLETKSELAQYLLSHSGEKKNYILNMDDDLLSAKWAGRESFSYTTRKDRKANLVGKLLPSGEPFLSAQISLEGGEYLLRTSLVGGYNLPNALAALAVGHLLGVSIEKGIEAIEAYTPTNKRSQLLSLPHYTLILDAYNANLSSMKAALSNLGQLSSGGRKIAAVLGDMLEMGEETLRVHTEVLKEAVALPNLEMLYLVGGGFAEAWQALTSEHQAASIYIFSSVSELLSACQEERTPLPSEGSTVLIKGSRGIALEKILPIFEE
ncbi:MAG: UDP-N-acetylmuramoyl-tripeptide--D-alanyl-D-alanine ligase [Porphyromonas sp.]|nr:UDP-N-acetylmuramoyl-tripeptide--D-alanyl-D-alanine ligase [Porphyromonas sp.]